MAQELTDAPWAFIKPLLPQLSKRPEARGRPWRDARAVLNGILWPLRTGAQGSEMPGRYPPQQTAHRRFRQWPASGVMDRLPEALARDPERRGKINLEECVIDGSFSAAKKGALGSGKPSGARAPRSWATAEHAGLAPALCTGSASPHETKCVKALLDPRLTEGQPARRIGDKACDSDSPDEECKGAGREDDRPAQGRSQATEVSRRSGYAAASGDGKPNVSLHGDRTIAGWSRGSNTMLNISWPFSNSPPS